MGVDVFFVISGYLITGILLRQLREDRFSLVDFWARRVRRIAPAAIAMVVGTLLIGGFLQTPERYASLARSAMAHLVMASNCYFTRDQLKIYADRSYYRDEDHLTRAGAMHYLEPAFKKFMGWIPREESQ